MKMRPLPIGFFLLSSLASGCGVAPTTTPGSKFDVKNTKVVERERRPQVEQTPGVADFNGPSKDVKAKPGERVWAAVQSPFGTEGILVATRAEVVRVEKDKVLVKTRSGERWAPALFVDTSKPPAISKGQAVLAEKDGEPLRAVVTKAEGSSLEVTGFDAFGDPKVLQVQASDVIPMQRQLHFGRTIVWESTDEFSKKKTWRPGTFLASQGQRAWVQNWMGKWTETPLASVRPASLTQYRVGQSIWYRSTDNWVPAKIAEVLPDGTGWKVEVDRRGGGNSGQSIKPAGFADLTEPI